MWVLGLVILVDEIDKNIVRGMITPLKEEFGVGDFGISADAVAGPALQRPHHRARPATSPTAGTAPGPSAAPSSGGRRSPPLGATSVNFPMLVGMRSALGFGQAITEPSAASACSATTTRPSQRGKAFSIQQVMLLAGTGIGVALGGGLAAAFNWRVGLLVSRALPGLFVAFLVFRMREPQAGARPT